MFYQNSNYMNEIFSKLLAWLRVSPAWSKIVVPLLFCALAIVFLLSSCGVTRAVIRSPSASSTSHISITTNNPTSVSLSGSIDSTKVNINPKNR